MDNAEGLPNVEGISESADRAARELRVMFSRLRRRLKEVSDSQDLTPSQVSALNRLSKAGAATASGLAASEGVRPQSMAATLAALDQRGLIERRPDPEDGRRQVVTLTDTGRESAEGTRQARGEWLARTLQDHYSEEERLTIVTALTLLERLTEA